jgi:hypothetical protein
VVGQIVIITAEGYNQNLTPSVIGDERYYPAAWSSTEAGRSGEFTVTGQVYQAAYIPSQAGSFTITATYQKQVWDGAIWTDTTTDTQSAVLTVGLAPVANAANNTLTIDPASITAGGTVTITAAGDRQDAAGKLLGEERYYPTVWSSTENKSGVFTVNEQVYSSRYTTASAGIYTITAVFQKQSWNGTAWIDVATDTKTVSLPVNAQSTGGDDDPGNQDPGSEEPSPSTGTGNPGTDTGTDTPPVNSVGTAVTTQEGGQTVTTVSIDPAKLEQKLSQEGKGAIITIPVDAQDGKAVVELTGQMLKSMEDKEALLQVKTENVTYTLPAAQINMAAVLEQLGAQTALQDIKLHITVAAPAAETVKLVQDTAKQQGYQLAAQPVEFKITASSGNKSVDVSKFNGYVERTFAIPEGTGAAGITTGIVLNADGSFSHVPTAVAVIGGKAYATINSLTNSTYAVIYSPKTFADVNTHWAKEAVNDMASRLVIEGSGEGQFEPDRDITRAEFAAIIVKGLGLMRPGTGKDVFQDVAKGSWYYDAVAIAHEYGIIDGYEDGTFGPLDQISREQAMAITARAMKLTGLKAELTENEADKLLAGFEDAGYAAGYAKLSIASCLKTGIITGRDGHTVVPKSNITRAEVAVIVKRLLQASGLI